LGHGGKRQENKKQNGQKGKKETNRKEQTVTARDDELDDVGPS
jgi:hypothetical protein